MIPEYLGWLATGVFAGSYFFSRTEVLRRVQMAGALIWVAYGILIAAPPVVAANVLVFAAAGWTLVRQTSRKNPQEPRNLPG